MRTFRTAQALNAALEPLRRAGRRIGFVPTMGALHEGHLSLVRKARSENDAVVVSIFVNPTQFGPREDFSRYPRPFRRDQRLLAQERADFLYAPEASELYPEGFETRVVPGELALPLCGKSRPTHFSGVATVVLKLLEIVRPARLYLGQKDYQQVRVIERMVEDFQLPVRVRRVETSRERDGLARSSRNVFLSDLERREAPGIYRALLGTRKKAKGGSRGVNKLKKFLTRELKKLRLARVDYAEVLDAQTLKPMVRLTPKNAAVAACAVYYAKARLIDNILIRI